MRFLLFKYRYLLKDTNYLLKPFILYKLNVFCMGNICAEGKKKGNKGVQGFIKISKEVKVKRNLELISSPYVSLFIHVHSCYYKTVSVYYLWDTLVVGDNYITMWWELAYRNENEIYHVWCVPSTFFFKKLFIFGCVGSSLLCAGFL